MAENPWYPLYVGDYDRKTSHLSMLEHGAYILLMNHYYAMREPLPSDLKVLYRICRAFTPSERKSVVKILSIYFTNHDAHYVNKRCDSEIDKLLKYSKSQSAKAQLRHSHGSAPAQPRARVPLSQPQKEEKDDKACARDPAFKIVYDFGCDLFPQLASQTTAVIHQWISSGADLELDIIPEIKRIETKEIQVRGWGIFTQGIADSHAKRLQPMPKGRSNEKSSRNPTENTRPNKAERLNAALQRAAESGGFASEPESEEKALVDVTPEFSEP